MTAAEKQEADRLLARALHRTATSFSFFETKYFVDWIKFLRPSYRLPGRETIRGRLLDDEYTAVQTAVVRAIKQFPCICMTLDGVTNHAGKQVLNMMAAGPLAYFLEHFQMNLQRESSDNLRDRLLDARHRLRISMGLAESEPNSVNDDQQRHRDVFNHAEPMWTLCTDSPNVMKSLRIEALSSGHFTFAYGCAPHGLNNLSLDWIKWLDQKQFCPRVSSSLTRLTAFIYSGVCLKCCVCKNPPNRIH